jgi:hypothetical protein
MEVVSQTLQKVNFLTKYKDRDKCKKVVKMILDSEQNYFFTNDKDYLVNRTEIIPVNSLTKYRLRKMPVQHNHIISSRIMQVPEVHKEDNHNSRISISQCNNNSNNNSNQEELLWDPQNLKAQTFM